MIQTEYLWQVQRSLGQPSSPISEATQLRLRHFPPAADSPLLANSPAEPGPHAPERHRVRLLVYGSPRAIEHTIKQLHQLRFVDHFRWNPIRDIPENGIHISPAEAQAYSFLLRELRLD